MIDFFLINNSLPLEFQAKVMDITYYLCNHLFIKYQRRKLVSEKCQTNKKQDISYIKIFGIIISVLILKKKDINLIYIRTEKRFLSNIAKIP